MQDPYSLRCVPQVHGAVRDALDHLRRVLDIELNSATDNPLVFPGGGVADPDTIATGGGLVISGGNFHGEPIGLALDFAKLALAELGAISERRTALLVDARLNGGLPAFLAAASGVDSGMMIYQYTAAALASENKVLAHPATADSIPTSANQEDHVSMGSIAARHARRVLDHVEQIVAIELLAAAQALDLRVAMSGGQAAGAGVEEALARVRAQFRHLDEDREPGPDRGRDLDRSLWAAERARGIGPQGRAAAGSVRGGPGCCSQRAARRTRDALACLVRARRCPPKLPTIDTHVRLALIARTVAARFRTTRSCRLVASPGRSTEADPSAGRLTRSISLGAMSELGRPRCVHRVQGHVAGWHGVQGSGRP